MTELPNVSDRTADGAGRDSRRWGAPDALVAAGVLLNLAVYAALGGPLWQDGANHAARYALIARAWFGTPAPWVRVVPLPAPYLGLDAVGAILAWLLGPATGARVVGAAALSAPALGLWLLLRRTAPALRAGALAGVLLGFSFYFLNGMLSYVLGVGAALAWTAAWWPRRARCTPLARAGLGMAVAGLYTFHLSAACAALAVAGAELVLVVAGDVRAARASGEPVALGTLARTLVRNHAGRIATLATAVGAVAALWLALVPWLPPTAGVPAGAPIFRPWRSKAWALTMPFYTFGPWELVATLPAYLLAAVAWLRAGWARPNMRGIPAWQNPLACAVVVLGLLYLVTPTATAGGYSLLDIRWLLPAALLAFAAAPGARRPPPRWATGALAAGCVAHACVMLGDGRVMARDLADYDAVLAALPPVGRLVALVAGPQRFARVDPRLHYAHWQTVRTGARVGGLFAYAYAAAGKPPAAFFHFAHFRENAPGWFTDETWNELGRPALPWVRLRHDYDYVVLAGDDPAAVAAVRAGGGCLTARRGAVAAYTTRPCAVPNGYAGVFDSTASRR